MIKVKGKLSSMSSTSSKGHLYDEELNYLRNLSSSMTSLNKNLLINNDVGFRSWACITMVIWEHTIPMTRKANLINFIVSHMLKQPPPKRKQLNGS